MSFPESSKVTKRIDDWKLRLIDLTKRNKAIYFQPTKTSHLRIISPDIETTYNRLVTKGRSSEIQQPPQTKPGEAPPVPRAPKVSEITLAWSDPNISEKVLRNLSRRSQSEYTERGIRVLYVTFGQLRWAEKENPQEIISPLLLSPVELTRESPREPFQIKIPPVEDLVLVNPALRLKLKYEHGLELPPLPEDEEQTPLTYLSAVQKQVEELGWKVEPTLHMGIFSFSKLAIYQDLTDNFTQVKEHQVIKALAGVPVEGLIQSGLPKVEDLDLILDPDKMYQILDADSSQQLCIQYSLRGQSFVMQGPPGTGKSQTIANIISEYIADGRSVLFVSEKMAALEVVYNRLREKDLDEYCLELHSTKANKREVINELSRSLTEHLKSGRGMSEEQIDILRQRRSQLNTYAESLHQKKQPSNLSAYDLLNKYAELNSTPYINSSDTNFSTLDQLTIFRQEELIRQLQNAWIVVEEGVLFPWRGCNVKTYTVDVRGEWLNTLTSLINSANRLRVDAYDYCMKLGLSNPRVLEEYDAIQKLANIIDATPYPPPSWFTTADLTKLQLEAETLSKAWSEYWGIRTELDRKYDSRFRAIPKGTADGVIDAWAKTNELLRPNLKGDGGLLRNFDNLSKFLEQTTRDSEVWSELIERLAEILGLPTEPKSINIATRIYAVAKLAEAENKPERAWFDKSNLDQAQIFLTQLKTQHKRREELKASLIAYREEFLSLDHASLITYFKGSGSSLLRYLTPSYYRIRSEVSRTTIRGEVPSTILQDLTYAIELKALMKTIASQREEARNKLGSYSREGDPDFEAAEEAMRNAGEALRLIGSQRAPKLLRDNLCAGTKPAEILLGYSQSLGDSLRRWRTTSKPLRHLFPKKLPGDERRFKDLPLDELKNWASDLSRRLNTLREATRPALIAALNEPPNTLNRLVSDLRKSESLQDFELEEAKLSPQRTETFGRLYQGISTDWQKAIGGINWTRDILKALSKNPPGELITIVTNPSIIKPKLDTERCLREIYRLIDELNSRFSSPLWVAGSRSLTVDDVQNVSGNLARRIDDLQAWVDFNNTYARLIEEGLGILVEGLVEKQFKRVQLVDLYRKSIYGGLLNHSLEEDPTLRAFRASNMDQAIEEFRSLDSALIEEASTKVIQAANAKKPQGVFVEAPDSEISILLREASKKRKQMPLRQLLSRIPNLVRRLKPCFLMSPISVSQFILPDKLHFDLVVFDEASQIFTEDAVGSIYRGDTLIVAGDNKQLPPTPFFQYIADSDSDWDEETGDIGVYESVLDECMGMGLPVSMLRWHYRSKHDSLIVFSNKEFYDNRLVLFPSALQKAAGLGIEFNYVQDGVYDRGGVRNNPREAEVVADLVFRHFSEHPDKSLGVMTFSISQMNTVKDEIESRFAEKPGYDKFIQEDRLRGFFVKNLENVQGDERDVMIIDVGYGPDKSGAMTMNFGPLNSQGGERRLNVAITRAREKVILVSSIKSGDIDLSSTKSLGVRCLHDYLAYAELASLPEQERSEETPRSEIEGDVFDTIRSLGYIAVPQVGESTLRVDIGVKTRENPDRFILGILLDGEGYRSTATARDRDRLREQVLEGMEWNLHRIWSPEWVQRRDTEVERLAEAIKDAEMGRRRPTPISRTKQKKRGLEQEKVIERKGNQLPGSEPYRKAALIPAHTFNNVPSAQRELYLDLYRLEVRNLLPKIVHSEGPIHVEYAFSRLNRAVSLKPAPAKFHKMYNRVIDELALKGRFEKRGDYLWSNMAKDVKVRVPVDGPEGEVRPIEYIPPDEIDAAILHVLNHSIGLSGESLLLGTANVFKIRQTQKTMGILEKQLDKLIEGKKILQVGDILSIAGASF